MKGRFNLCLLVAIVFILAAGCAPTQMQLFVASGSGHTDPVRVLLAQGADVNAKDNDGTTALMLARGTGQEEISRMLKKAGAK